jgi:outer membrane protein
LIVILLITACAQRPEVKIEKELVELKVGVIDQDRVWTESTKAKQYQQELNAKIEEVQQRYQKEIEGLSQEEQVNKYQETYQEINNLRDELKEKFQNEVKGVIEEIIKEQKVDIVLNKQDVKYGGIDLTDEVIKNLE